MNSTRLDANRPPLRILGCSIADASNQSQPFSPGAGASASIFASVPPEVKTTQPGSTPTNCATSDRARSIQRRAARPSAWTEDAFPPDLNAASNARRASGRKGAVAFQSR